MKSRYLEHIAGVLFVTAILIGLLFVIQSFADKEKAGDEARIREMAELSFIDYDNPFHKILLREVLDVYYPEQDSHNNNLIVKIEAFRDQELARQMQRSHLEQQLTASKVWGLVGMWLKFILVYALVMVLTYYGVQTLGVWRFVRRRRQTERQGPLYAGMEGLERIKAIAFEIVRIIAYFVLFSPAYVIAYSLRTRFNTDTLFFMIILAVISNGLLVMYAHRFYTFLVAESRKGYVETARVKNLADTFMPGKNGIGWRQVIAIRKDFSGHILDHIYANARFQYLATIKEQASFLITGLIIIEMALNIHGHLSYEMLRQMLYRNWEIVLVIVFGIFLLVKATDIVTEIWVEKESRRFSN